MLAPLPSNHPQSVFQSVSLLFNYPFKAYNLLLRGSDSLAHARPGSRPYDSNSRETASFQAARVGGTWDRPCTRANRRGAVDAPVSVNEVARDKNCQQLCCETSSFPGRGRVIRRRLREGDLL